MENIDNLEYETTDNPLTSKKAPIANFSQRVLSKINNQYFFSFLIISLFFLLICLGLKSYYLFADTVHYYVDHTQDTTPLFSTVFGIEGAKSVDKYIRELDIAGLLGGIVGIFISLYITSVIEENNKQKEVESRKLIGEIRGTVSDIWTKERHFRPVDNIKAVIESISNHILHTSDTGKNLYIMSHDAAFGYLLSFRVHTILEYNNISLEAFKEMSFSEYYTNWEKFRNISNIINTRIHSLGKDILKKSKKKPVYATLTYKVDRAYKNYMEGILNSPKTKVVFFNLTSKDKIVGYKNAGTNEEIFKDLSELKDLDNVYFIPRNILANQTGEADDKQLLLQHLLMQQQFNIEILQGNDFDVKLLQDVDFNVYLNEMLEPTDECYCLFMFADQQSIANSGRKLIAFETRKEKYINDSFINIINTTN